MVDSTLFERMHEIQKSSAHPFTNFVTRDNAEVVLAQYLAMSQAFPFIQAGAQRLQILDIIHNNREVTKKDELTAVVANFLCWDETGGHYLLQRFGVAGISKILNTDMHFHANLLKGDIQKIFGKSVTPCYSSVVSSYLLELLAGLESLDPAIRCAFMVSFESHAGIMIDSLWQSLLQIFQLKERDLSYFYVHVGGNDPAEAYHIEMTKSLINLIVETGYEDAFLEQFEKAFKLHVDFCFNICS